MKNLLFLSTLLLLFTSCAKSILVTYSHQPENNATLVLKPSKATEKASVTVNDQLVVEDKHIKKVTIQKLPAGNNTFHMTSESGWYKENLNASGNIHLKNNQVHTELVDVPPYNGAYYAVLTGLIILDIVLIGALIL